MYFRPYSIDLILFRNFQQIILNHCIQLFLWFLKPGIKISRRTIFIKRTKHLFIPLCMLCLFIIQKPSEWKTARKSKPFFANLPKIRKKFFFEFSMKNCKTCGSNNEMMDFLKCLWWVVNFAKSLKLLNRISFCFEALTSPRLKCFRANNLLCDVFFLILLAKLKCHLFFLTWYFPSWCPPSRLPFYHLFEKTFPF